MSRTDVSFVENRVLPVVAVIAVIVIVLFASGNAHAQSGNVYTANQAMIQGQTTDGIVLQVQMKKVAASGTAKATGTGLGALVGGLLGNAIPDQNSRGPAAALGAMLGGVAGNYASDAVASEEAQEIVIGLRDARTNTVSGVVTIVQPAPFTAVQAGDQVLVVTGGGSTRVIKKTFDAPLTSASR